MKGPSKSRLAIMLCKKYKKCSRIELIYWLDLGMSTSYSLWGFLKKACVKGLLDDDKLKCRYDEENDVIIFEEVKQ